MALTRPKPHMLAALANCILYTVSRSALGRAAIIYAVLSHFPPFPTHFHSFCEQIKAENKKNGGFLTKTTRKLTFYIKNDIIYRGNIPGYSILYPKYSIFYKNFVYCIQRAYLRVIKIFDIITIG